MVLTSPLLYVLFLNNTTQHNTTCRLIYIICYTISNTICTFFRHAAAVWAHDWKWAQINETEDLKWANKAKAKRRSSGGSFLSGLNLHLPSKLAGTSSSLKESRRPPSNLKNIFYTGEKAISSSLTSRRPSASLAALFRHPKKTSRDMDQSSHSMDKSVGNSSNHSHSSHHSHHSHHSHSQNHATSYSQSPNHTQNHSRLCVFYDDTSDLFVAEIAAPLWEAFSHTHDFSRVEAPGEDPLLESFLLANQNKQCARTSTSTPSASLAMKELINKTSPEELNLSNEIALLNEEVRCSKCSAVL